MKGLRTGIVSEQELVDMFGTSTQKSNYKINGKFISSAKERVLTRASAYCTVKDLGDRKYMISDIKKFPVTKTYEYMHSSMYQYICPQILEMLLDKKKHINLTVGKWAREIDMINDNYATIKSRSEEAVRVIEPFQNLHISRSFIYDFYNHADNMIANYITNALEYLKKSGLVIWQEVYMIVEQQVLETKLEGGNVNVVLSNPTTRRATEKDLEFYSKCIGTADNKNNIDNDSDRYYSSKAKYWKRSLQCELAKKNIQKVYKTYEVYATNYRKCSNYLNTYNSKDNLVEKFNIAFSELIKENAAERYDKFPEKCLKLIDNYVESYACLTSFVIGQDDLKNCEKELDHYKDENTVIESHKTIITEG